jgi:RNA polymerase sigma-70 factor (ECF subfamily)
LSRKSPKQRSGERGKRGKWGRGGDSSWEGDYTRPPSGRRRPLAASKATSGLTRVMPGPARSVDSYRSSPVPRGTLSEVSPSSSACRSLWERESVCLEVFERELDYVYGTLLRLGARRCDIDDLLQDVFMVLYTNWATLDTTRTLRPWLFGVAFRVVRTRRRLLAREVPFEDWDPTDAAADPEEQLAGRQALAFLTEALARVPAARRSVLMMHDLEGVGIADIARQLSMTKFGVYARLYKGRKELASAARELWKEGAT